MCVVVLLTEVYSRIRHKSLPIILNACAGGHGSLCLAWEYTADYRLFVVYVLLQDLPVLSHRLFTCTTSYICVYYILQDFQTASYSMGVSSRFIPG